MGAVGLPIIKIKNVVPPSVDITDCERVPEQVIASIPNVERFELKEGDTLIAMTGATVGKVGRFPRAHERHFLNQRVGKVYLTDDDAADCRYIYYVLSQDTYVRQMFGVADGSAQANISGSQIENLEIPLPPLDEQRAIADVLGALDDKIEQNRRTARALEWLARAIFRAWFVDFESVKAKAAGASAFPSMPQSVFDALPTRFVDSEIGPVPEGWEVGRVSDLGEVICGKTPPTKNAENYGGNIPFITIPDMHGKVFVTKTGKRLSLTGANTQATRYLPEKSICVSCIATPGLAVITSRPAQTNQQINSIVPGKDTSPYYCYEALSRLGDLIRAGGSGGSVFHNLNKSNFSALPLLLSSESAIRGFHDAVEGVFKSILAFEIESQKLTTVRDYLLPKLLSGQVRVEVTEINPKEPE